MTEERKIIRTEEVKRPRVNMAGGQDGYVRLPQRPSRNVALFGVFSVVIPTSVLQHNGLKALFFSNSGL